MIQDRDPAKATSPEDTRMRILAATRDLFARKGRRGTTTREVAERAGVNEATLFRHFGNKEALITACVQHHCRATELEETIGALDGDLEQDLIEIGEALFERMTPLRDLIVRSLAEEDEEAGIVGTEAWRPQLAIHAVVVEYMSRRVQRGELRGDPRWLAKIFMGMVFARVMGRNKLPDPTDMTQREITAMQVDIFLNGVRSR